MSEEVTRSGETPAWFDRQIVNHGVPSSKSLSSLCDLSLGDSLASLGEPAFPVLAFYRTEIPDLFEAIFQEQ
jgi:hypothetical protein